MANRMYSDYFGLRENVFSITPDPRYLFMSERHREAFAHLLYGVVESGGFVQLTGEVGTGKTTICRAFLEHLPDDVDVALLLNPPDTARELLLGILSELRISLHTDAVPLKSLVDRLNLALLESHARGRRTVVIIDEAQNIKSEVLEQVRLLTNLETPTAKLLQVFLIGQPELRDHLADVSLRQVAQRITARYHLEPLNIRETDDYIRHRLAVGGCRQGLFDTAAMRQVYLESQGVPRVINILCDRALLGAFANDQTHVDAGMVRNAAMQWRGRGRRHGGGDGRVRYAVIGIAAGMLVLSAAFVVALSNAFPMAIRPAQAMTAQANAMTMAPPSGTATDADVPGGSIPAAAVAPASAFPVHDGGMHLTEASVRTLDDVWRVQLSPSAMQREAERHLLLQWGISVTPRDEGDLCDVAQHNGLRCWSEDGTVKTLLRYNRPAVMKFEQHDRQPRYGVLVAMDDRYATLQVGIEVLRMSVAELEQRWDGEFVILWAPPLANVFLIGSGAPRQAVLWLRHALDRAAGDGDGRQYAWEFDDALRERLRQFQAQNDLVPDGIAGMQTLTLLVNLLGESRSPQLQSKPSIS